LVTFDTSALLASFDKRQPTFGLIRDLISAESGPFVVPVGIMSEVGYFLEKWRGNAGLQIFLDDIRDGIYTLYCDETNVDRISELTRRYRDLRLGYADAAVIACAERHGGRVATLDHRHFGVVAREGTIQIVP
jgi:predicted nucleic acid-binding protein